jgi:hypothetical protein
MKSIVRNIVLSMLLVVAAAGCKKGFKEPPISGKPTDPPVALRPAWQPGQRYIYRVDAVNSTHVPRRNTSSLIRAEVTVGQDLGLTVTNVAPDGSRVLQLELLAIQMETSADDRVTLTFDSDNKALFYEDNALADRLQKLVGARLAFHLSADNKITKVDGTKEFNARTAGGSSIRGVAAGVYNRLFSVPFFREVIEMGMLPAEAVKVGDKWTVSRPVNAGLWSTSAFLEMTYQFKGWQLHDGTNCARLEYSGVFKSNASVRTNESFVRRVVTGATSPNIVEGRVSGRSWYEPGVALAVESFYDQDITTKSTSVKRPRVRVAPPTNTVAVQVSPADTNAPPVAPTPGPGPSTNAPGETITTTTTTRQQTTIKLIAIEPIVREP